MNTFILVHRLAFTAQRRLARFATSTALALAVGVLAPSAQAGDEAVVFGDSQPVELLAAVLGTIPYEIFTSISGRVKRVYFQE